MVDAIVSTYSERYMELAELNRFINTSQLFSGNEITPTTELQCKQLHHFRTSFHGFYYDKWRDKWPPTVPQFL